MFICLVQHRVASSPRWEDWGEVPWEPVVVLHLRVNPKPISMRGPKHMLRDVSLSQEPKITRVRTYAALVPAPHRAPWRRFVNLHFRSSSPEYTCPLFPWVPSGHNVRPIRAQHVQNINAGQHQPSARSARLLFTYAVHPAQRQDDVVIEGGEVLQGTEVTEAMLQFSTRAQVHQALLDHRCRQHASQKAQTALPGMAFAAGR
jgi:hypothetical protein